MKLRQKLAMVLASAMIISAVPVVTMAYSSNQITGTVSAVQGQEVTLEDGLKLIMNFEDSMEDGKSTTFYLDFEDFTVNPALYNVDYIAAEETLREDIAAFVNTQNFGAKEATTPGAVVDGAVTAKSVKTKIDYKKGTFADADVVAEVTVKYFTDAEGNTATKTVKYTAKDLKDAGVDLTAVEAARGTTKFTVDPRGAEVTPEAARYAGTTTIEVLSGKQIRVTVTAEGDTTKVALPIVGKMSGEAPAVVVDPYDSSASVSGSKHYLSRDVIGTEKLTVKADEAKKITVTGGEIAAITVSENTQDALTNASKEDRTITLDLGKYSDLVFSEDQTIKLVGERAFAPNEITLSEDKYTVDGKQLHIVLPNEEAVGTTTGAWEISGIQVEAENLKYGAEEGDVEVTITSAKDSGMFDKMTAVLAQVAQYDVEISVEAAELVAGRESISGEDKDTAILTIKENVKESLDDKRWAYFEMPEGVYVTQEAFETETIVKINDEEVEENNQIKVDTNKDGYVTGFSIEFEYANNQEDQGKLDPTKANVITMEMPFFAPLATEAGEYSITVESKYMEELEGEHVVAKVATPVEIEHEQTTVKVGLEKQELGNITIKETADKMIHEGELVLAFEDVKLETSKKDIVLETAEGSKMEARVKSIDTNKDGSTVTIEIDRAAKTAGVLTIKGLVGTIDRTIPEGHLELQVSGSAIQDKANMVVAEDENVLVVEDYIKVGTPNTEDNNGNELNKGTATFKVGEKTFTHNDEEKEMDAAPYLTAKNRMMVPVRYLSEAFGVAKDKILFNEGTVTMFIGNKVIQVENNSNVAILNGVKIPMQEKMAIKDGRSYVPMGEIARLLNIDVTWDNDAKTATFTN